MRQATRAEKNLFLINTFKKETAMRIDAERDLYRL
jgi:hypothetical protein